MTLSSYSDLVSSVLAYLARDNDGDTIPTATFIDVSEREFNRRLRTHNQETSSITTTTAGTATYPIPADCLNIREITLTGNMRHELQFVNPSTIDEYCQPDHAGFPKVYTIEGQNIRIAPTPNSSSYSLVIKYYQTIPAITADATNWLFDAWPDLYLYAALCEAMVFLGEDDADARLKFFLSRREQFFTQIETEDLNYKTTSGPLRIGIRMGRGRRYR